MVRNGYIIEIDKDLSVNDFVNKLRNELKTKTYEIAKSLVALDVEKLWDAKLIDLVEYEESILKLAIRRVNEKMMGISNGVFSDARYDLRSTMNIVKMEKTKIIALFTTPNKELKKYFESLPEVSSYKYYADEIEEDITEEENNERGLFWQAEYQSCDWKTSLLGLSAQITLQPNLEELSIEPADLKEFFRNKNERMVEYIESRIVVEKVRNFLGNMPIDKISPLTLEEFFREAYSYLHSPEGRREYDRIKERIQCGFLSVDVSVIALE
jgi:hypothetical protein